jgi:hypothetical protein
MLFVWLVLIPKHIWIQIKGRVGVAHTNISAEALKEQSKNRG